MTPTCGMCEEPVAEGRTTCDRCLAIERMVAETHERFEEQAERERRA